MAATCASVKLPSSDVPRWPDVPKATGVAGAWLAIGREQRVDVDEVAVGRELPGARVRAHGANSTALGIRLRGVTPAT